MKMGKLFSEITPLVHKLYSQKAKDLVSENMEIIHAVIAKSFRTSCREIRLGVLLCVGEETIRFIKQGYDLEDVRVPTYRRIQAISALVLVASIFAVVYLGSRVKLEILVFHVLQAAKRIFGIPDYRYYALTDGIKEILSRTAKGFLRDKAILQPHLCRFSLSVS